MCSPEQRDAGSSIQAWPSTQEPSPTLPVAVTEIDKIQEPLWFIVYGRFKLLKASGNLIYMSAHCWLLGFVFLPLQSPHGAFPASQACMSTSIRQFPCGSGGFYKTTALIIDLSRCSYGLMICPLELPLQGCAHCPLAVSLAAPSSPTWRCCPTW